MSEEVTEPVFEKGDRVKINAPKELCHGRTGKVDHYTESGKLIYVDTPTGRVWVYPWEIALHKER
jgi:hypothetical protein